jgi:hypothetical protein
MVLLFTIEAIAQRLTLDMRHHIVQEIVCQPVRLSARPPAVKQRQDIGVLQMGRGLDLGQKTLGADDRCQLRPQDLERHLAVVLDVVCQVHGSHTTSTELVLDGVAVGQGGGQAFERVGQWAVS